jgi:RNA polymerase sigma-70 factor (ECF subfamily)
LDERELVNKILQGDEQAKTLFYVTHRERLYRDCVYLLGYQDHEAEDVVQEAFLTAFRKLPEFEFRSSLGTWLTQIGIYLCYNRYRRRIKTVAHESEALDSLLSRWAMEKDREMIRGEEKQAQLRLVEKCLSKIGEGCQEIIRLRDLEGRAYSEIGKTLGIPMGTVMSRLSRCKKVLKALVEQALKEDSLG